MSTNKIEAGTKIIITTPWAGETNYKTGDIFTVELPSPPGVYVLINGVSEYIASDEFEVYTEPEFKAGERVITTVANPDWNYLEGFEGEVLFLDNTEPKVRVKADNGGLRYVYTHELKHVTPEQETVQPRKIKVLSTKHPREYEVDDVLEVHADQAWAKEGSVRVHNKHGGTSVVFKGQWEEYTEPLAEWEKELLHVTPRSIAFEDIKEGDLIKAEYTENGAKHVVEGVAGYGYESTGNWVTSRTGGYVANSKWGATYTLLERPEPPKPNPFAEANVGSVATSNEGTPRYIWVKESEKGWRAYSVGGDYRSSHPASDEVLRADSTLKITYNA